MNSSSTGFPACDSATAGMAPKSIRSAAYRIRSNQYGDPGAAAFTVSATSSKKGVSRSAGYVYRRKRATTLNRANEGESSGRGRSHAAPRGGSTRMNTTRMPCATRM